MFVIVWSILYAFKLLVRLHHILLLLLFNLIKKFLVLLRNTLLVFSFLLWETHVDKFELLLCDIILLWLLIQVARVLIISWLGGHNKILLDILIALDWVIYNVTTHMSLLTLIADQGWIRNTEWTWIMELLSVLSLRWTLNRGNFFSFFAVIAKTHVFCSFCIFTLTMRFFRNLYSFTFQRLAKIFILWLAHFGMLYTSSGDYFINDFRLFSLLVWFRKEIWLLFPKCVEIFTR